MLGTALYPTVRESVYKHAPLTALSSCIFATFGCHVISEEMSESKSQRINYYTRRNVQILPSAAEDWTRVPFVEAQRLAASLPTPIWHARRQKCFLRVPGVKKNQKSQGTIRIWTLKAGVFRTQIGYLKQESQLAPGCGRNLIVQRIRSRHNFQKNIYRILKLWEHNRNTHTISVRRPKKGGCDEATSRDVFCSSYLY